MRVNQQTALVRRRMRAPDAVGAATVRCVWVLRGVTDGRLAVVFVVVVVVNLTRLVLSAPPARVACSESRRCAAYDARPI